MAGAGCVGGGGHAGGVGRVRVNVVDRLRHLGQRPLLQGILARYNTWTGREETVNDLIVTHNNTPAQWCRSNPKHEL